MATVLGNVKNKETRAKLLSLLTFIVTETQGPNGSGAAPVDAANDLLKAAPTFIQIISQPDAVGNVQIKATPAGIAAVQPAATPVQASPAVAATPTQFLIEDGFAVPVASRGGARATVYPFASMNLGQSFFVPATDAKPNPAKAMASTVSGVNKRYAKFYAEGHEKAGQPTGKDGRKFTVRARTIEQGEKVNGARVYRIE